MQNVQKQLEHKFLGKYLNIFNVNITKLQYLYCAIKLFLKTKWKSKKCTTKLFFPYYIPNYFRTKEFAIYCFI